MILDVKFTGVSKATNQRARLILLGTDWLNPKDQRYDWQSTLASALEAIQFPLCIWTHIKAYSVYKCM